MSGIDSRSQGFTLVEMLVAIGIISILLALLLPAVMQGRETARRAECSSKLRQLGLAMQNYQASYKLFPPGGVHMTPPGMVPLGNDLTDGRAPWTVLILPYLEQTNLYNTFNFEATFACRADLTTMTPQQNLTGQLQPLPIYTCPSNPNGVFVGFYSSYAACQGGGTAADAAQQTTNTTPRLFFNNGMFFHNSSVSVEDVIDGTSNTIMIGETKYIGTPTSFQPSNAWWPWSASIRAAGQTDRASLFNISATCDPINFPQNGEYTEEEILRKLAVSEGMNHGGQQRVYGSWHTGGAYFGFADGSVHFLQENMDIGVYRSLGQRADGGPEGF